LADIAVREIGLRLGVDKTEVVSFDDGFIFVGEEFNSTYPLTTELHDVQPPERRTIYVATDGAYVRVEGGQVVVSKKQQELLAVPHTLVGGLTIVGSVTLSSGARSWALQNNVPVSFLSRRGSLQGWLRGPRLTSPKVLRRQIDATSNQDFVLEMARSFVIGKLLNCRVLLQRAVDRQHGPRMADAADEVTSAVESARQATSLETVRGFEGSGAASYFGVLPLLFPDWTKFSKRVRRPPTDPVNACLSFGYTLLSAEVVGAVTAAGLEPSFGFLHQDDDNRPSLALDLMEELRPTIVDSVTWTLFARRELQEHHFRKEDKTSAVLLTVDGRERFIRAYEQRMLTRFKHVVTGASVTYRRALLVQARQVAKAITTGKPSYAPIAWRR